MGLPMDSATRLYVTTLALASALLAQPSPAPADGDAPCSPEPSGVPEGSSVPDMDAEGFMPLFNGRDFTGWWQNCGTSHSTLLPDSGAIFRVDTAMRALYTTQRGSASGGVLMSRN